MGGTPSYEGFDERIISLAKPAGLQNLDALQELLDDLSTYANRNQFLDAGDKDIEERRKDGRKKLKSLIKNAAKFRKLADDIADDYAAWVAEVRFSPVLLADSLDVDLTDPQAMWIGHRIAILQTLFEEPDSWYDVLDRMDQVAVLPVKFKPGRLAQTTLKTCIQRCRKYWETVEGKSWSMSNLAVEIVRRKNDPANLKGPCEIFVAAALASVGLTHSLQELCSAWKAADIDSKNSNK